MHEDITEFPKGVVLGSVRLAKGRQTIDVVRLRYGSRTRFVEKIVTTGKLGPRQTAFRKSDDFSSDKIADRFIMAWIEGFVDNQKYRVVHQDPGFFVKKNT